MFLIKDNGCPSTRARRVTVEIIVEVIQQSCCFAVLEDEASRYGENALVLETLAFNGRAANSCIGKGQNLGYSDVRSMSLVAQTWRSLSAMSAFGGKADID